MFAWAPIAELMFIIEKDNVIRIAPSIKPRGGLAPHASPIISEPRLGKRNSDLDILASNFIGIDIALELLLPSYLLLRQGGEGNIREFLSGR